jgi:ankyrin repeat protein
VLIDTAGANTAPYEHFLSQAVETNNVDIVDVMLRAPNKVPLLCVSRSLLPAAMNDYSAIVSLLIQADADVNYDGASALICAVRMSQVNIVTAILMAEKPPSGIVVDQALAIILSGPTTVINNSHHLIEILLCAGPIGTVANDGLVHATQSSDIALMQLFLKYDIDINYNGGAAVGHAIQHNHQHLAAILLQDQTLAPDTASDLVGCIPRDSSPMDRVAILSKLLVSGASGINCNELLIVAAEQGDMETAQMLVTYGRELHAPPICSVDYNGARCLQKAVALNHFPMLKLLAVEGRPSSFSLSNAFSTMPSQVSEDSRFLIAETLLQAGAKGPGVNEELLHVVSGPQKSNRLAELLVKHGATVLDETLFSVISQGLVGSVQILLSGNVSPATCTAAIPLAMKIADPLGRYHIVQLLLAIAVSDGADNIEVSNALVTLLQNAPEDKPLLHVLCQLGKANINSHEGLAVELATKMEDCEILDTVLRSRGGVARPATVERGLVAAITLPTTDRSRRDKVEMLLRGVKPKIALDDALIQEVRNVIASKQDLGVIQVLLAAGADVNAREGAPVWGSIPHPELTDLFLTKLPNAVTLAKTFKQAMNVPEPARCILCDKLWRAGVSGEINSRSLLHVIKTLKETTSFVPLLRLMVPRSDVNYNQGEALRIAVKNGFIEGIYLLLNARPIVPTAATKSAAFQEAMLIQSLQTRHDIVSRLLKAKIPKSYISEALIIAVTSGDFQLSELLIKFGASVEHNSGQAVIFAATSGHHGILKSLVAGEHSTKPSLSILDNAFMSAATLKDKGDRESYYLVVETILQAGVRGDALNIALVEAVKEGDVNIKLSEMLHRNGASAEYNDGESVIIATRAGYLETLTLLLRKQLPESILKEAYVMVAHLPNQQRYPVIELLLKAKKSVDRHVINSLIHATQQNPPDRRLIKLLLSHNVFDEGQSMQHAASKQDMETLALFLKTPQALPFISAAFNDAVNSEDSWKSTKGIDIMKLLLQKGAKGDAVGEALCKAAEKSLIGSEVHASEFLLVLLQSGANVDYQQGRIIQFAARLLNFDLLQKLLPLASAESKAAAVPLLFLEHDNPGMALKFLQAIVDSMQDGDEKIFATFEHANPELNHVLFMALRKFPRKPQILDVLLDMGYSANQSRMAEIDPAVGLEQDPILCWALSQGAPGEHQISNISIENLIDAGGKRFPYPD